MSKFAAAAIIAALAISGCASTKEVLSKPPKQTFHSEKSQNDVAFCLANKNGTAAFDQDDGSKLILVKNGYGGVSQSFTVWSEGTGSKIDWREQFETFGTTWKQCVGLKPEK
jgi:hypothetical protein